MPDSDPSRPSILFLSSSFLTRRERKAMRGVQLFDMLLAAQLLELGVDLTLPIESTWDRRLRERIDLSAANVIRTPSLIKPLWNTLAAQSRVLKGRYDALIVGNPTRGLAPALRTLRRKGRAGRITVLAHRTVKPGFARVIAGPGVTVVCVNKQIAAHARRLLPDAHVVTSYGIPDADRFSPRDTPPNPGAPVRFGVLGKLDNPWKGADDAIEAFNRIPEQQRQRCELRLASYERSDSRPVIDDDRIIAHDWMDSDQTPAFLRTLDVLLVPSTSHETFSQAIVQGMLTGLPIIARDLPVLAEKLDTGAGVVAGDVQEMSQAMARLAGDASLRATMGAIARKTALERYAWDTRAFVRDYVLTGDPAVSS